MKGGGKVEWKLEKEDAWKGVSGRIYWGSELQRRSLSLFEDTQTKTYYFL